MLTLHKWTKLRNKYSVYLFFYNLWNSWSIFNFCKVKNKLTKFYERGEHLIQHRLDFFKISRDLNFLKILSILHFVDDKKKFEIEHYKKNVIFLDSSDSVDGT